MEDDRILALYWARNEDAIRETDKSYGSRLYGIANSILHNTEDAEESVSDTYWKAWASIPPKRPRYLFAYLAKICRHNAFGRLDWQNAEKRNAEIVTLTQEMELCIPDRQHERSVEGKEISRAINLFLDTLSKENRLIFLRRYWYCDSIEQISIRYGMHQSKVKTRLYRLRQQLKVYLESEDVFI